MEVLGYMSPALSGAVAATAFAAALGALALIVRLTPPRRISWAALEDEGDVTALLFQGEDLIDATADGRRLLGRGPLGLTDLARLKTVLAPVFPDLPDRLSELRHEQSIQVSTDDGEQAVAVEWRAGLTRIALRSGASDSADLKAGAHRSAIEAEAADLHRLVDLAPMLVWREDPAGAVRWANGAYIELALRACPEEDTLSWPLPRLFPNAPDAAGRVSLDIPADEGEQRQTLTFELSRHADSGSTLVFGVAADRLADAEGQHREFLQTLTKTFAHLPIGLALFDQDRRLAVFNPALTDLSSLQPVFLSRRPTLYDFLDALREARRMPEPKDYLDWRRRIGELEHAAAHGTHIETWALPDGQTYRVTGRPHPAGAVAFLFEDITSEVSLTRRFRSELEFGQAVIDSMPEAVAVFGPSRALVLSNAAYERLWDGETEEDESAPLPPTTLAEALDQWRSAAHPSPVWADLSDLARGGKAEGTTAPREIRLKDGRAFMFRVSPLPGNAMLIGFTPRGAKQPEPPLHEPARSDTDLPACPPAAANG